MLFSEMSHEWLWLNGWGVTANSSSLKYNFNYITLAFPADIGRKPASPVRESRQRFHAGESGKPTRRLMKRPTAHNMAAPV